MSASSATIPRIPYPRLSILAAATFVSVSSEFLPSGILPEIAQELNVGEAQVGLLVSVFAFTVVLTTAPLTSLTTRFSRKSLLIVLLGIFALANLGAAIAPDYWFLLSARVVGGAAHGLFWAVTGPYAARMVHSSQVVRATSVTNAGSTMAFVLGIPMGAAIGHAVGWRWAFVVMAILVALCAVLVALYLPPVSHLVELRTGEIPIPARKDPTLPVVILICVTILFVFTGQNTFTTYIAPWWLEVPRIDEAMLAPVLFVGGIGGAIGLIVTGLIGDRDPRKALLIFVGGMIVSVGALGLIGENVVPALVLYLLWSAFLGAIPPLAHGLMMRDASLRLRDIASAWLTTAFNIAIGTGALIGSAVMASSGPSALPWFLCALAAPALVLLAIVAVRDARRLRP